MPRAADEIAEIHRHRKALMIARLAPELLMKCARMNGKQQAECEVCTNPDVPCIGCIRRRLGDTSIPVSECPVCWDKTSIPCPTR